MIKFRTMVVDAEARLAEVAPSTDDGNGVLFKMRADPRVTRVGAVLRRFSLDELPQLFNVLRGEMSLVGPRPPLPSEVDAYESDAVRRLRVRPGMTGLWQVSGRSDLSWDDSVRLDLWYVDNWSLALDAPDPVPHRERRPPRPREPTDDHDDRGGARWPPTTALARELAAAAGELLLDLRDGWAGRPGRAAGRGRPPVQRAASSSSCAAQRPGDGILSEESPDDAGARAGLPRVWIVDPLDGTREFGEVPRDDWAVHVALWVRGALVGGSRRPTRPAGTSLATDAAPGPSRDRARGRSGSP